MATAKKAPAKRRAPKQSDDPAVQERQELVDKTLDQAENGTGLERNKGYAGTRSGSEPGNRNLDPGQATDQQIKDMS